MHTHPTAMRDIIGRNPEFGDPLKDEIAFYCGLEDP